MNTHEPDLLIGALEGLKLAALDRDAVQFKAIDFCFGTSPIQAEKSRPDRKASRIVGSVAPSKSASAARVVTSVVSLPQTGLI